MVSKALYIIIPILFIALIFQSHESFATVDLKKINNTKINTSSPIINPKAFIGNSKTLKHYTLDIYRSEICNTLDKNHIKSDCPTIAELSKFDTSNQHISGKFIPGPNGDLIRTNPQVKNNWLFYKSPIVCVDCVSDLFRPDTVKTIIVEPHTFVYVNKTEISKNNKYTTFENQLYQGCNSATIAYSPELLNQTINYLLSGCTIKTSNGNKSNTLVDHPFLPKDSVQIRYNNYLKEVKKISLGNCINYKCDIKSWGAKW